MSRCGATPPGRGDSVRASAVVLVTLLILLAVSAVAMLPAAALAQGSISGEPDISVVGPDRGFDPGEHRNLTVYLQNDPRIESSTASEAAFERVTTARAVRVTVEDGDAPVTVRSGTVAVGSVPAGQTPVNVAISIDEDAEPGTYRLPVQVRYRATTHVSEVGGSTAQVSRVERTTVTIEILEGSRFRVEAVGGEVRAGDRATVAVTMANVGEADADEATITFRPAGGGIELVDGESSVVDVGAWPAGASRTLPVAVRTDRETAARGVVLEATVAYRDADGVETTSPARRVPIATNAAPSIALVDVVSGAQVGGTGPVELRLRNEGPGSLEDAAVAVTASGGVAVNDGERATVHLGSWSPDEVRGVGVDLDVPERSFDDAVSLDLAVTYRGADGGRAVADRLTVGVDPAPGGEFTIAGLEAVGPLHVGETDLLEARIENTGPVAVRDLLVTVANDSAVRPAAPGPVRVGDLAPGESAPIPLRLAVDARAVAGPHRLAYEASYRTAGDRRRVSDHEATVPVAERRDPFAVAPVDVTFAPGDDGVATVNLTNRLDRPVHELAVSFETPEAFESESPSAYVDRLEPGVTATVAVDLHLDGDVAPNAYALPMTVTYRDDAGYEHRTRAIPVPIVVEVEPSTLPFGGLIAGLVVLALLAALAWWVYGAELVGRGGRFGGPLG